MNKKTPKQAVLLTAHFYNEYIDYVFRKLSKEAAPADVILLLHDENQDILLPEDIAAVRYDLRTIRSRGWEMLSESLVPGSNHLPVLWFHGGHRGYDYIWVIEYDALFNGDWGEFFAKFTGSTADFLTTHLETHDQKPDWYWWNALRQKTPEIPCRKYVRSFNPVYRLSESAWEMLTGYHNEGNYGHHEILIPTVLKYYGFTVGDLNDSSCSGPVYLKGRETDCVVPGGTMRDIPAFADIEKYGLRGLLFHPVKDFPAAETTEAPAVAESAHLVEPEKKHDSLNEILRRHFKEYNPRNILILGSVDTAGILTEIAPGTEIVLVTEDKDAVGGISDRFARFSGSVHYRKIIQENFSFAYSGLGDIVGGRSFGLIVVDGPWHSSVHSRPQFLDLIENGCLAPDGAVIVNDAGKYGIRQTLVRAKGIFPDLDIYFYEDTPDVAIIRFE